MVEGEIFDLEDPLPHPPPEAINALRWTVLDIKKEKRWRGGGGERKKPTHKSDQPPEKKIPTRRQKMKKKGKNIEIRQNGAKKKN